MGISKTVKDYCDNSSYDKQPLYVLLISIELFLSLGASIIITFIVGLSFIGRFIKIKDTIMGFFFPFGIQVLLISGLISYLLEFLLVRPICKAKFKKTTNG